jgi:hypothetical protein
MICSLWNRGGAQGPVRGLELMLVSGGRGRDPLGLNVLADKACGRSVGGDEGLAVLALLGPDDLDP